MPQFPAQQQGTVKECTARNDGPAYPLATIDQEKIFAMRFGRQMPQASERISCTDKTGTGRTACTNS